MPGSIGSFMISTLNNYIYCRKYDVNKQYKYRPEGNISTDQLKKSLDAEAVKFTKALAKDGKQITEQDFVNYFKSKIYKNYNENTVKRLYNALNFNTNPSSKGLDNNEIASFLISMDIADGTLNGNVNQENIIGTYGLMESEKHDMMAQLFKLVGEDYQNNPEKYL